MTKTEQRLTELEDQIKNLHSLSGGILKLLFLSLSFHTQNGSLTNEQKETIKDKIQKFLLNEPALLEIMNNLECSKELEEIANTMKLD